MGGKQILVTFGQKQRDPQLVKLPSMNETLDFVPRTTGHKTGRVAQACNPSLELWGQKFKVILG